MQTYKIKQVDIYPYLTLITHQTLMIRLSLMTLCNRTLRIYSRSSETTILKRLNPAHCTARLSTQSNGYHHKHLISISNLKLFYYNYTLWVFLTQYCQHIYNRHRNCFVFKNSFSNAQPEATVTKSCRYIA